MTRYLSALLYAVTLCVCYACETDNTYSTMHARAHISPVTAIPPLHTAVHSPGEYCMVWRDGRSHMQYQTASGITHTQLPTALTNYDGWHTPTGSGFIIGRANVPEVGQSDLPLMAYDRACPNCYKESISKSLDFGSYGRVVCPRCRRQYDLNNAGYVVEGQGDKLVRYRCNYTGQNLIIGN